MGLQALLLHRVKSSYLHASSRQRFGSPPLHAFLPGLSIDIPPANTPQGTWEDYAGEMDLLTSLSREEVVSGVGWVEGSGGEGIGVPARAGSARELCP